LRTGPFAAVAVACALLGGIAALGVGKLTGWTDSSSTTTVFRAAPVDQSTGSAATAAVGPAAKPLSGNGFSPSTIYSHRSPGVVTIVSVFGTERAQGSGFVVSPRGYILTSSHVITNAGDGSSVTPADSVFVEFQDRDRVPAKVVGWDIYDDVGLIKVNPADHRLAPVPLGDSAQVKVGQPVAAIGSPFGNVNSLSVGVVSATERSIDSLTSQYSLVDAIQTDAAINHGNSGGPLFDARGRVIGINAQIRSDSGSAEGVGFAVPIDSARRSMTQLIAAGRVSYAYVGIETEDLIPTIAKRLHYPISQGAVVTKVNPNTPGSRAGLKAGTDKQQLLGAPFIAGGDVIVSIADHRVGSAKDVVRVVTEELSPGQSVPITFIRAGRRHRVTVKLAERPASPG